MGIRTVVVIFTAICIVVMIITMIKRKCLVKGLVMSMIQGVSALYAVKLIGLLCGIGISVNSYTLGTAAVLGSPGVALILAAEAILFS